MRQVGRILSLVILSLPLYAQDAPDKEARTLFEAGQAAMADRNWEGASRSFQEAATKAPQADFAEEASFLSAKALDYARQDDRAVASYQEFLRSHPQSPFASRARFLVADVFTRLKRFDEAAEVVRPEALAAAGEEHRASLAKFYVDLANEFFEAPDPANPFGKKQTKPTTDYNRASAYFAKAQEISGADADLANRIAFCRLQLGDAAGAQQLWQTLIQQFPKDPRRADAFFFVGYVYAAQNQMDKAREVLSILEDEYGDSPYAPTAVALMGQTYLPDKTKDEDSFRKGIAIWEEFLSKYGSHSLAPQIQLAIGQSYANWGDQAGAISAMERFVKRFPEDKDAAKAQFAIGQGNLALKKFDEATQAFQKFLATYPNDPLWQQAQTMVVETAYAKGHDALDQKKYDDAIATWEAFQRAFPLSPHCAEVQYAFGAIAFNRGDFAKAIAEWEKAKTKYAQTEYASVAALSIAQTTEEKLAKTDEDIERAVKLYREVTTAFPGTSSANQAAQRLQQMLTKALSIRVDRAYATNEKPLVHVDTRNAKRLAFKAYKIDLEEYFRKKQTIGGVERIAVEIVKPDKTWEADVDGYLPYRVISRDVELPFDTTGAWILAVSTVSDPDKHETEYTATALFLRTDLSIITKSTSNQVLVFARNEVTGKPWPGARVLVSNGSTVKFELTTGADGTVLQNWEETWGVVKTFAAAEGNIASGEAQLQGTVAWGYQTKGYVYTDRPVYRPNQTVNWKAILRKVGGGFYTTTANEPVKVQVVAPNGLVMYEKDHVTNEYGCVTGEVALGDEPALGDYQIKVTIAEKDFFGKFQVLEYKKPDFVVDVLPEKECYLSGDEVKAKIQVSYYFGGPVRNAEVVWQVLQGPYAFDRTRYEEFGWYIAAVSGREKATTKEGDFVSEGRVTTDANGVTEIRFRARAGAGDAMYTVLAAAQDVNRQWVSGAANVPVTTVEAFAVVKTARQMYQPKEKITVNVLTVNALHSPVALEGKVIVSRVRNVDGHEVKDPVSDYDTRTDDAGKAEVQLAIDNPGAYVVTFVAKSGTRTIEGGTPVQIAGDAEDLANQAKVITDRRAYLRDETAKVLVNSPVAGVTALLTFEAEKVLEYRVVDLADRSNTFEIPVKDLYAPNVYVSIAIPANHRLYEDAQEILVFKYLNVSVLPEKKILKPREEAIFSVKTTDQNGKPVAGEFSLAVVDDAIYAIASENAPNVLAHFYDQRRPRAVATHSSYEFRYDGVTVASQIDLLDESARKDMEKAQQAGADSFGEELAQTDRGVESLRKLEDAREDLGRVAHRAKELKKSLDEKSDAPAPGAAMDPNAPEGDDHEEMNEERNGIPTTGQGGGAGGKVGGRRQGQKARGFTGGDKAKSAETPAMTLATAFGGNAYEAASAWGNLPERRYVEWVKPELRKQFEDTAFWAASLMTNENGEATVRVKLPDNLTTWRTTVRGITRDTLVGSAITKVECRLDVVARVAAPRFLTQNDEVTIVGTVNNALTTEQQVKYVFHADGVETETLPAAERKMAAGEAIAFDHQVRAMMVGPVLFHVEGMTTVASDAMEIGIETLPHGMREVEGASGSVEDRAMSDFVIPDDVIDGSLHAELRLAPSVDGSLLDALIYLKEFPYGCIEQTLNRFAPGVQALRALKQLGTPNEALAKQLDGIVKTGLLRAYQLQNVDGGWGWWNGNASNPFTTAYTIVCVEEARQAGYAVNGTVREKAMVAAKQLLANAGTDYDTRAYLLYALSYMNEADMEDLSRCARQREALSTYGASVLALALKATHRDAQAAQVAEMITRRAKTEGHYASWTIGENKYGWMDEPIETTGYALLALLTVDPTSSLIEPAAQWLVDRRPGGTHWGSTKSTAAAIRALSAYVQAKGTARADYTLKVTLNDKPIGTWEVKGGRLPEEARLLKLGMAQPGNASLLVATGKNTLRFEKQGSGKVYYTLRAEYYRKGEDIGAAGNLIGVERRYEVWTRPNETAQATMNGYDVVQAEKRPKVVDTGLREATSGDRFRIHLTIDCRQELSYVSVEDPLPSGCEVIDEGMTGGFDHQERRDAKMAFFFTKLPQGKTEITYLVQAVFPGKYHVMPTWVSPMYRPEVFGRGPENRLAILTENEAKARATARNAEELPDEVYQGGKKAWKEERKADAKEAFRKLLDRGDLRDEIAEELLGYLLSIAISDKDHRGAIASYEELMDRNPSTPIRLSDLRELAVAYDTTGEDERALGLYDHVLLGTYEFERGAVAALQELNRAPDAEKRWSDLLGGFPERSRVIDEAYALTQSYVAAARAKADVDLRKRAIAGLRRFLAWFPNSSWADEVDWTLLSLIQEFGSVKGGIDARAAEGLVGEAGRFLTRYPDSPYADEAQNALLIGYYALGKFDEAMKAGETLLTRDYPNETGVMGPSPYRDSAHYLLGKVYHVKGDFAKAVEHYTQSTVGDARDSLEFLTSRGLKLPETAVFGASDPLALAVQAKNLTNVTLKVYQVDLMVLLASRKDLGNVAKIDLTGIRPLKEWNVALGGDTQYRWHDESVPVPVDQQAGLASGKGAYLVVAKGEGLDASSVLMRSEITLKVQKVENRVRVYVTDRTGQQAVKDAYVKVSDGTRIIGAGYTDVRGIFEVGLGAAPGQLSIVAEHGDDVALIRE